MMHPRSRLLQAFVDRELPADRDVRVRNHVAQCERCSARVKRMRRVTAALHAAVLDIDALEPASWTAEAWRPPVLDDVREDRLDSPRVLDITTRLPRRQEHPEPARREGYRFPLRWAALFIFATTAAGATALLVRQNAEPAESVAAPQQSEPAVPDTPGNAGGGGVVVQPDQGAVVVQVTGGSPGSLLFVELTEQRGVNVQVTGDGTPRFSARDGHVDVTLGDVRADVRVQVPSSVRDAVIRVGDRVLATVRNGTISPADAAAGIPLR
jgi:hypothetical protein